jgi:prepilin-type N-terminal cleavage/methylation domain-containing protein
MIKAFTLMELMIVVVLIGILSSIGIMMFGGTKENVKKKVAEVSTSSIHLAQQEYISNNGSYYYTSSGCSSNTTQQIITNLFDGNKDLSEKDFYYCISGNLNSNTFKVTAKNIITNCQVMRDEKNNVTHSNC